MARTIPEDEKVKVRTVSLPPITWEELDGYARKEWRGNRSAAIFQIFKEWKKLSGKITPDETPDDDPAPDAARSVCREAVAA